MVYFPLAQPISLRVRGGAGLIDRVWGSSFQVDIIPHEHLMYIVCHTYPCGQVAHHRHVWKRVVSFASLLISSSCHTLSVCRNISEGCGTLAFATRIMKCKIDLSFTIERTALFEPVMKMNGVWDYPAFYDCLAVSHVSSLLSITCSNMCSSSSASIIAQFVNFVKCL